MLRQATTVITVPTLGRGLIDITAEVAGFVRETGLATGLVTLFVRHTSASLLIQENADPAVRDDLERFFTRLVPDGDPLFRHRDEGPDDMPAHVRAALTAVQLSIPVVEGRLSLGTWQGVYLWEHRTRPHRREVVLHMSGNSARGGVRQRPGTDANKSGRSKAAAGVIRCEGKLHFVVLNRLRVCPWAYCVAILGWLLGVRKRVFRDFDSG